MDSSLDLVARTAAIAERARSAQPTREQMRERYPFVAEMADWARAGGLDIACLRWNGQEWGKPVPDAPTSRLELVSCGAIAALQAKHPRRWG